MTDDLINQIAMMFFKKGVQDEEIVQQLQLLFMNYDITPKETHLAVRNEDRNRFLLNKFLVSKTVSGRTERTIIFYKNTISSVLKKIGKTADEITTDDLRLYLAYRTQRDKVSYVTANNELRACRSFYVYLSMEEIIDKNPCLKIERLKCAKIKKEAFSELDVEKIRLACETRRETAMVELMLSTGCRVSELANIKTEEIENDKLIVHGKGNKDRTVYLNAKALMSIKMYLEERSDNNPYLFAGGIFAPAMSSKSNRGKAVEWYKKPSCVSPENSIDKGTVEAMCRKIGRRAGVKNVHPHRFRRTCATFALKRGMPILQVSKMLGHEQISTTQIYLDLSEDELEAAHKKYVV